MMYKEKLKDPRWQKKRLKIFERDGWKCVECGNTEIELHIHHLEYTAREPWDEPSENLETLCRRCHFFKSLNFDFSDMKKEIRDEWGVTNL